MSLAQIWLGYSRDEWCWFARGIRHHWRKFTIALLLAVFVFPLMGLFSVLLEIDTVRGLQSQWSIEAYTYILLAIDYHVRYWFCATLLVIVAFLFIPLALLCWVTTETLTDLPFQVLYPWSYRHYRLYMKYTPLARKLVRCPIILTFLIYFSLFAIVGIRAAQHATDAWSYFTKLFPTALLPVAPVVFTVHWTIWIKTLRIREKRGRMAHFRRYLFSPENMRRTFKSLIDVLLMLALLGWLVLPKLVQSHSGLTALFADDLQQRWDYAHNREIVLSNTQFIDYLNGRDAWIPPDMPDLYKELNIFSALYDADSGRLYAIKDLMSFFLLVATLAGSLAVGIPTFLVLRESAGYRRAVYRLTLGTAKTLTITIVLQVLLQTVYLVDLSKPIGFSIVFFFLLTYFLGHEGQRFSIHSESPN